MDTPMPAATRFNVEMIRECLLYRPADSKPAFLNVAMMVSYRRGPPGRLCRAEYFFRERLGQGQHAATEAPCDERKYGLSVRPPAFLSAARRGRTVSPTTCAGERMKVLLRNRPLRCAPATTPARYHS